ncbi:MAG TPA: two-component sensor histidine kinase, partial [Xanthomonadaceae bacterium]|nr:two-component sensor histidine kinase [Xanthomonadaceae bacterium]
MSVRLRWFKRWRPRSLQARQLLAASLSLIAFLALAGYALDAAFADTAQNNLRERLKNYATSYVNSIEFVRDGSLYIGEQPPDPRFDVPGGGIYAEIVRPNEQWTSMSAEGPVLPAPGPMLQPRQEQFSGPLEMVQIDGSKGEVYRYGMGVSYVEREHGEEIPYTIYIMEDARGVGAQLRVFRGRVWFYLGSAGVVLLL